MGVSRNTVKKYLRLFEVKGYHYQTLLNQQDHQVEALFAEPDEKSKERYKALEKICTQLANYIEQFDDLL